MTTDAHTEDPVPATTTGSDALPEPLGAQCFDDVAYAADRVEINAHKSHQAATSAHDAAHHAHDAAMSAYDAAGHAQAAAQHSYDAADEARFWVRESRASTDRIVYFAVGLIWGVVFGMAVILLVDQAVDQRLHQNSIAVTAPASDSPRG
ncbi:hypothetical protein OKHIL_70740 [Mycolicibacterium mageritense]